jgi:hypothetical protein
VQANFVVVDDSLDEEAMPRLSPLPRRASSSGGATASATPSFKDEVLGKAWERGSVLVCLMLLQSVSRFRLTSFSTCEFQLWCLVHVWSLHWLTISLGLRLCRAWHTNQFAGILVHSGLFSRVVAEECCDNVGFVFPNAAAVT